MTRFLAELKRRQVVRVALVYSAAAFAVLQAADLAAPRSGLPDWTVTFVLWLAILGLPIAIVLLGSDCIVNGGSSGALTALSTQCPAIDVKLSTLAVAKRPTNRKPALIAETRPPQRWSIDRDVQGSR
jgi:hypothetical protein